jgi:DNA-binding NtrC family response regulator
MPGMNGVELTDAINDLYPDTAVIWITAHGRHRFQSDERRLHVYQCLEKPIQIADIRRVVADAAERARA